jgi:3-deoxy-7-phosphoheptulonate synthase
MPIGKYADAVAQSRDAVRDVLDGRDDRLIVIAGPCSIHDPPAAFEYALHLARQAAPLQRDILLVMRAYFEKPRTTTGWKGLVSDPAMNGSCDMIAGLTLARWMLLEMARQGIPAACEWLDPLVVPYLSDAVTWGAIGARTVESQVHRQLASGLPMPVGFKNGTAGNVQAAADACLAAAQPHSFLGMATDGRPAIITTPGNKDTCIVLRGGNHGPNYRRPEITGALALVQGAGLPGRIMIDASHGNSGKDPSRQRGVAAAIASQVADGNRAIVAVMLESNLEAGRQEPGAPATLTYGQSVTDACIGIEETGTILRNLAAAARARRAAGEWVP